MKSILALDQYPRELYSDLPSPLSQPGVVWHVSDSTDLPPSFSLYRFRYADPGGILALISRAVGPPTGLCILGDNVAGVTGWRQVPFEDQYRAVTRGAGAFFCGSMCYLRIAGKHAALVLDMLTPRDMTRLPVGRGAFMLCTTPGGGVDTEAIALRVGEDEYLLSIGGNTRRPSWLAEAMSAYDDVTVEEPDVTCFNLKGPRRLAAMQQLVDARDRAAIARLRPFHACQARTVAGLPVWILCTTIGLEMWAGVEAMHETWQRMLGAPERITPCGWDVLHTFRLECTEMVFGVCPIDLHRATTLWELGYSALARTAKPRDFIGRDGLLAARTRRKLWLGGVEAVRASAEVPMLGDELHTLEGDFAGYVTTAAFSPEHGRPLAFAHLKPRCRHGQPLVLRDELWRASTVPFAR